MLEERFEIPILVVVRSRAELAATVAAAPLGPGAIYFSRLAAQATKSRISRLVSMPVYQRMTVRNWRTTTRLLQMLDDG